MLRRETCPLPPPTWAIMLTDDCVLTRSAPGNQVEGQNNKDFNQIMSTEREMQACPFSSSLENSQPFKRKISNEIFQYQ